MKKLRRIAIIIALLCCLIFGVGEDSEDHTEYLHPETVGGGQKDELLRAISLFWGNCLLLQEDYAGALEQFTFGTFNVHNYPYFPPTYATNAAYIYLMLDDHESAFNDNLGWGDLITNNFATLARTKRAQLYALAFDYDSAISDINIAIELAEENELDNTILAELYTIRGEIIFLIYEWDRVLDNFNTALELDPNYAPAYFQRGVLYYTMAQREEALNDFKTYLELAPEGNYAEQTEGYIDSIQIELDALRG
jgi:tetratricopeptide (TPR) repeat protein